MDSFVKTPTESEKMLLMQQERIQDLESSMGRMEVLCEKLIQRLEIQETRLNFQEKLSGTFDIPGIEDTIKYIADEYPVYKVCLVSEDKLINVKDMVGILQGMRYFSKIKPQSNYSAFDIHVMVDEQPCSFLRTDIWFSNIIANVVKELNIKCSVVITKVDDL